MGTFNHLGKYVCECGREFMNSQAFNGHKGHCDTFLKSHNRLETKDCRYIESFKNILPYNQKRQEEATINKLLSLTQWVSEQHTCEKCGKVMTKKFGSGRFCSRSCANSKTPKLKTKKKLHKSLLVVGERRHQESMSRYYESPKRCSICGLVIDYDRRLYSTCGNDECLHLARVQGGQKSASNQTKIKRSKNEILFCEMCEKHFKSVRHNEAIFNGWDADIIIDDYKLAILWNGVWHYKQVMNKQHGSLKQIQNRDKLKVKEIKKCGYTPYIIKDVGKNTKEFIVKQFENLLESISGSRETVS